MASAFIVDIEKDVKLSMKDVYKFTVTCSVDTCKDDVVRYEACDEDNTCTQYRCMAGADEDGGVACNTPFPESNFPSAAVHHWQSEHSSLPLRDLVLMNSNTGAFLQISDLFA